MASRRTRTADTAGQWQAKLDTPVLVAAAMVVPIVLLESANLPKPWPTILAIANLVTWLAFLVEVVVMLAVSPNRGEWARSHKLEIAVVVLTPPFIFTAFAPLRSLRLLRLLRLFRIGPLLKRLFGAGGDHNVALVAFGVLIAGAMAYHELQPGVSVWEGLRLALLSTVSSFIPPQIKTQPGHLAALATVIFGSAMIGYLKGSMALQFIQSGKGSQQSADRLASNRLNAAQRELMRSVEGLHRRLDAIETPADPGKEPS